MCVQDGGLRTPLCYFGVWIGWQNWGTQPWPCRKLHGALFATWAVVPRGRLEITRGEGAVASFESSPGVRRRFCRHCGCHLVCEIDSDPGFDWFTPGTLDGGVHPGHAPEREQHIFVGSKVQWRDIHDGVDQYETYPPGYGAAR